MRRLRLPAIFACLALFAVLVLLWLAQLWSNGTLMGEAALFTCTASIGGLFSIAFAVAVVSRQREEDGQMPDYFVGLALFVAPILLWLAQLWSNGRLMDAELFGKLVLTLYALLALSVAAAMVSGMLREKKLRDDGYLN
jgi:hypothetical protein